MVRATMQDIQKMHDILKRHGAKYDPDGKVIKGTWRRGAGKEFSETFGKTRATMYNWLEAEPKRPVREAPKRKRIPKYVETFRDSETVKDFIEKRVGKSHNSEYVTIGLIAWRILGKKDPISWVEEDYEILWNHPDFRDEMMGTISFHKACALRAWMKHCGRRDLQDIFTTDELKRPKGAKKTHWLKSEYEIESVINNIEYPDTLIMFFIGIQCGSRFSSIKLTKPSDISYATNQINMYETKTKDYVERDFPTESLELLKKYIYDFNFKTNQKIFPRKLTMINDDLKQAGLKAEIPFTLTSHVAMKHTFVSLASNRGVSLEVVSQQTGTDPTTLKDFYAGLDRRKIRHELMGEEYSEPTYHEVIVAINQTVRNRYQVIKEHLRAIDGLAKKDGRKTEKLPKPRKPRAVNWKAVEAMIKSEKTPPHLKKAWRARLKLHRQGLSDAEIKERMKK
ncbi:hypothetical protein ES702_04511 [subsurface metagenome]